MGEGKQEHFRQLTAHVFLHLSPKFTGLIQQGIDEKLNQYLLRYVAEFDGIVISWSDLRIIEKKAKIFYDNALLHFQVSVKFLIFSPVLSQISKVNKQSADHIGLLCFGIFNGFIRKESLIACNYVWNGNAWQNDKSVIEIGNDLSVKVDSYSFINEVLNIECVPIEEKETSSEEVKEVKKRKNSKTPEKKKKKKSQN